MIETQEEIQNRLIMDSMRNDLLSYAMGIYPKFINSRFATSVAYEIQMALEGKHDRVILTAPPRHGKLSKINDLAVYLNHDAEVKLGKFGDIEPGFHVLHHTGGWCKVKARSPDMKTNVKVTLDTGESLDVHENHEWLVRDVQEERRLKKNYRTHKNYMKKKGLEPTQEEPSDHVWKIIETKELFDSISVDNKPVGKRGSRYRYLTPPMQGSMVTRYRNLDIDPYYFGYWLGDGRATASSIYVGQQDYEVCKKHLGSIYKITSEDIHKDTGVIRLNSHFQDLHHYLPINNKHIPEDYKLSSEEQRKQLLAGLIDSDGHVCQKTGRVRFINTNKQLIDDVCFVIRSLGWRATVTQQEPALSSSGIQGKQVVYTVSFHPSSTLPTIYERKKINIVKPQSYIAITGVERIPDDEQETGFCIEVDSPDHTYVVGETFITTHNSLLTSEIAPAWFMGKNPTKKIIGASHNTDLATDFGGKVRDNIANPLHEAVFGWEGGLDPSKAAAGKFSTNKGGEYRAVGVGKSPIGKGADVYIIDDPISGEEDVRSKESRDKLKDWYSSAVLTRLEGQGTIILMHQRWHEDDLAGWLIKEFPEENWRVINFPALIEDKEDQENDYLGRNIGEALIPSLHSKQKLERLKGTMSKKFWFAMYQQKPRGAEGDKFSRGMLKRYAANPSDAARSMNVYIIVDPCGNDKTKKSDYATFAVIGVGSDGNFYILDMIREKLELKDRAETLINLHRKWRPISVHYESYGMQSDIQYIEYVQEDQNYRFTVNRIKDSITKGGQQKERRIERLIPDMHNERWYAPQQLIKYDKDDGEYDPIEAMLEEMESFPVGKHDDTIDCISRIYDIPILYPNGNVITPVPNSNRKKVSPW